LRAAASPITFDNKMNYLLLPLAVERVSPNQQALSGFRASGSHLTQSSGQIVEEFTRPQFKLAGIGEEHADFVGGLLEIDLVHRVSAFGST
jgi:hypothetical protein